MNRGYTVEHYREFVDRVFAHLPDATLAGDFIVGFPTETDEDFEATCELVRTLPFKNSFIFKYSPRPGTTAFDRLADDVPDAVKRSRNNRLLSLQSDASLRTHRALVGQTVEVLFDSIRVHKPSRSRTPEFSPVTIAGVSVAVHQAQTADVQNLRQLIGRTAGDMIVAIDCDESDSFTVKPGNICRVKIDRASPLLLLGSLELAGTTKPRAETT